MVVTIIGILMAIAIPTFLGTRRGANDRAAQTLVRNLLVSARAADIGSRRRCRHDPGQRADASTSSPTTPREVPVSSEVSVRVGPVGRPVVRDPRFAFHLGTVLRRARARRRARRRYQRVDTGAVHCRLLRPRHRLVGPVALTGWSLPAPAVGRSLATDDRASRRRLRALRPVDRLVPQRRHLAGAAPRVDRAPAVALPALRRRDRAVRQHPGALVDHPAGPVPALRGPDLGPLPARRARLLRRSGSRWRCASGPPGSCRPTWCWSRRCWRSRSSTSTRSCSRTRSSTRSRVAMVVLFGLAGRCSTSRRRTSCGPCSAGSLRSPSSSRCMLISPRGMGFGDVKLSFSLGVALGWLSWGSVFLGLFLGFLLGAVIGVLLIATKVRTRKRPRPVRSVPGRRHGPGDPDRAADARPLPRSLGTSLPRPRLARAQNFFGRSLNVVALVDDC